PSIAAHYKKNRKKPPHRGMRRLSVSCPLTAALCAIRSPGRDGRRRSARWPVVLVADFFPGRGVGHQGAQQLVVELVAGLVRVVGADQAVAEQIKIADRVEDLVLDELV